MLYLHNYGLTWQGPALWAKTNSFHASLNFILWPTMFVCLSLWAGVGLIAESPCDKFLVGWLVLVEHCPSALLSLMKQSCLIYLFLFVKAFLMTNIINLWRPSTNPRLSLWCDQTYTDQLSILKNFQRTWRIFGRTWRIFSLHRRFVGHWYTMLIVHDSFVEAWGYSQAQAYPWPNYTWGGWQRGRRLTG